jgi:Endonuclease NucS
MKRYTKAVVSEQELEDLIRRNAELVEEGLVYVDHQKPAAGGRLDVLLVDSGSSLVVAELKVIQDDGMLIQGLDYYDYVSTHVEAFPRLYKAHSIDPTKKVRLFLVAPTFSPTLVNRCKWLDLPISLFTFSCLKFEGEADIVPVFIEEQVPPLPPINHVVTLDDHLNYITDVAVRAKVSALLDEIKNWKTGNISLDAITYAISMKINGRVFAHLYPRRQHFIIATYDASDEWKEYAVKTDDDLVTVKPIAKAAMERRVK